MQRTRRRDQEQQAEDVGDEPGRQQQRAAEDDQHAVDDLAVRELTAGQRLVEAPPRGSALRAQQPRTEHRVRDQQQDRPPHADRLTHLDQERQLGDRDDDEEDYEEEPHRSLNVTTAYAVNGTCAVDSDGGKPMQADGLDQRADVRLRMREPQRHAARPQALREAREVDHQRRIRERQPGQIHDHVARRGQRRGEGPPAPAARRAVLVPLDAEDRELCVEGDDAGTVQRTAR